MVIRLKYNTYYLKKLHKNTVFFLNVICLADFFVEIAYSFNNPSSGRCMPAMMSDLLLPYSLTHKRV